MVMTLPALVDLFVETKRLEGRTEKTCEWYHNMVSRFAGFVGEDTTLEKITLNDARAFVASLQSQESRYANHPNREALEGGLSPASVAAYVRAIRAFSSWLLEDGFTKEDIFARLKVPKVPRKIIRVLSEEEIKRLFAHINPDCFLGARLHTVVSLFLDTGLRATELCELQLDDVAVEYRRLKVMGKGQKERFVFFGISTQKALLKWKLVWRATVVNPAVSSFFTNADGSGLTYSALNQAIKRLGNSAGIPRLHVHLFRHTFAVRFLMNGGGLMELKDILGHTDISTTQRYLSMTPDNLQVQYERFSPMDRIMVRG